MINIIRPLYLFHGFEAGIKYNDDKWKINDVVTLNFHISKTPAFWIAQRFADHFSWYINAKLFNKSIVYMPKCYDIGFLNSFITIFMQKYLFCIYQEEDKWHHVSTDIRCPNDVYQLANSNVKTFLKMNEENEYLSHKDEKFKLIDVVYKFQFGLPFVNKFYIMKRIK